MVAPEVVRELVALADSPEESDLPRSALLVARIEYLSLDPAPTLAALTRLGALATARLERLGRGAATEKQVEALIELLFDDERFRGNEVEYDVPRNSFLNDVVPRRTGLRITLSVVYMEVARRAGLLMEGLNFPGRFLVRCRVARRDPGYVLPSMSVGPTPDLARATASVAAAETSSTSIPFTITPVIL